MHCSREFNKCIAFLVREFSHCCFRHVFVFMLSCYMVLARRDSQTAKVVIEWGKWKIREVSCESSPRKRAEPCLNAARELIAQMAVRSLILAAQAAGLSGSTDLSNCR